VWRRVRGLSASHERVAQNGARLGIAHRSGPAESGSPPQTAPVGRACRPVVPAAVAHLARRWREQPGPAALHSSGSAAASSAAGLARQQLLSCHGWLNAQGSPNAARGVRRARISATSRAERKANGGVREPMSAGGSQINDTICRQSATTTAPAVPCKHDSMLRQRKEAYENVGSIAFDPLLCQHSGIADIFSN